MNRNFDQTRQALDDLGYTYALHTTWSYVPGVLEKWRIFIPAKYLRQELDAVVNYLIEQLRGRGVYINDVKENHVWAQPWPAPPMHCTSKTRCISTSNPPMC